MPLQSAIRTVRMTERRLEGSRDLIKPQSDSMAAVLIGKVWEKKV